MEVKVQRTLRQFQEAVDIVRLPDGHDIAVPQWMLDPVICNQLPQATAPRIALGALLRLVTLLAKRALPCDDPLSGSEATPLMKGMHVPRQTCSILSATVGAAEKSAPPVAPTARSEPRPLSRTTPADAAPSGHESRTGKEQP